MGDFQVRLVLRHADARVNYCGAFYGQSEKCARVLLEKLPPQSFPKFANLAMAGNPIPTCLAEAYGSDAAKFQALVNATP